MFGKIREFFDEVKTEFRKVVFPSKEELKGSTWVVIVTVIVMAVFLGTVDIGLSSLVEYLFSAFE